MFLFCVTSKQVIGIIIETFNQINAAINVMPEGGGGSTGRGGDFERPWPPQVGNFSKF